MASSKKPESEAVVKVTITLPPDLVRRLDELAAGERRSRSNAAALLLERALASTRAAG